MQTVRLPCNTRRQTECEEILTLPRLTAERRGALELLASGPPRCQRGCARQWPRLQAAHAGRARPRRAGGSRA